MKRKANNYVRKLLRDCGIGEESLQVEVRPSLNYVLGANCRFSKVSKVFLRQDIYYIPQIFAGDGFVCGRYPVKIARDQSTASIHLIGQRQSRGKVLPFDVIVTWRHRIAFVGTLEENLALRELSVDNLVKALESRLDSNTKAPFLLN